MNTRLLKNIDAVPALPESVQAVERVYHDKDSSFEDLQRVIEKDPLLTADILRAANAPLYGLKRQVTNVQQAVSLLGRDVIRSFALNSAVDASFTINLSPYHINKEQFSLACERQLGLTIAWLIRRDPKRLAYLAPAAFLVNLGRVIISKTLLEEGNESKIQEALDAGKTLAQAEKYACGAQVTDVTATLFNHWHFEPEMIHLIRYSDDPDGTYGEERAMAAELYAIRETVLPDGSMTAESITRAKEIIEEFELDLPSYERALEHVLEA
ncbi:MAG: histidine kinase [Sulfurimonas sp.]|nr:MAG: histidine kinase [Sulfurimonas sp.]